MLLSDSACVALDAYVEYMKCSWLGTCFVLGRTPQKCGHQTVDGKNFASATTKLVQAAIK